MSVGQVRIFVKNEEIKPKVVYFGSLSNPLLKVFDIRAISDVYEENNCILIVDNTLASPIIQKIFKTWS